MIQEPVKIYLTNKRAHLHRDLYNGIIARFPILGWRLATAFALPYAEAVDAPRRHEAAREVLSRLLSLREFNEKVRWGLVMERRAIRLLGCLRRISLFFYRIHRSCMGRPVHCNPSSYTICDRPLR